MIDWPKDVISSISRRRAVIFIGAGVSMTSIGNGGVTPPSWKTFLDDGLNKISKADAKEAKILLNKNDYLSCCQILKHKLGSAWTEYLEEKFLTPAYQPNDLHKAIFSLDASIVMTPNVDKIYDQFVYMQTGHAQGQNAAAVPNNIKIKNSLMMIYLEYYGEMKGKDYCLKYMDALTLRIRLFLLERTMLT